MLNQSNTSSFFETSIASQILSITFTSVIIVIGSIGNLMNIYFIYKIPLLHSHNNILIAHLAVTDLLLVTLTLPMAIANSFLDSNIPNAMCQAFAYILNFLIMISLATTVAISIDRCCAVIYPYYYSAHMKFKYVVIFIVSTWICMPTIASLPLLGLQRYGLGEYKYTASDLQCWFDFHDPISTKVVFFIAFIYLLLTISATLISYSIIFYVACHKGFADVSVVGYISLRRSIRTTALIIGSNLTCFIPALVALSTSYFTQKGLPASLIIASYLLTYFNSAVNPIIYASTNSIIRRRIKRQCCYCWALPTLRKVVPQSNIEIRSWSRSIRKH